MDSITRVSRPLSYGSFFSVPVSAAGYTGPGDIVSGAYVWYGLRAYSAAKAATAPYRALQICDSTGANATDINILASGDLDLTTLASTITGFGANVPALATKLYDQITPGTTVKNMENVTTLSTRLAVTQNVSGLSGSRFAALTGISANSTIISDNIAATFSLPLPYSFAGVARRTVNNGNGDCLIGGNVNVIIRGTTNANQIQYVVDGTHVINQNGATDGNFHAIVTSATTSTQQLFVDSLTPPAPVSNTLSAALDNSQFLGIAAIGSVTGDGMELGIWPSDISANQAALISNMRNYWGF